MTKSPKPMTDKNPEYRKSDGNPQYNRESCYFCHEPDSHILEQHHIIPRRFGGEDVKRNVVVVCPNCHERLERLYDKRFYNKLGVKKPKTTAKRDGPTLEELTDVRFIIDDNETSDAGVSKTTIYNKAEEMGIHPQRTKVTIDHLFYRGDVYEPVQGDFRLV